MLQKLWTMKQLEQIKEYEEKYNVPLEVHTELEKNLHILDECYGTDRTTGNEDGGCVLLILSENEVERLATYKQILTEYQLSTDLMEFKDRLYEENKLEWYSELYILTEYAITIFYSVLTEDNKQN